MSWKKVIILVLAVSLVFALAACGSTPAPAPAPAPAPSTSGTPEPAPAPAPADDKVYTIKYAHNQLESSPQHDGVLAFKDKVEELSGGRIKVEVYPNNTLGSMREVIESVQNGTIELAQQPMNMLSNFAPACAITDFPYIFESEEILWQLMDGEMGDKLNDQLATAGFKSLGYMSGGPKWITTKNKPVYSVDDLKGMTIRVMTAPISISTFEAFGANPISIEYSELYNSLQQGVVDGQDNPVQSCAMLRLWEVQKYAIASEHIWFIYGNVMNKAFFDSLPADLQQAVEEAMTYANEMQRELVRQKNAGYEKELADGGMTIIYPDEAQMQTFIDAGRSIYSNYQDSVGADFLAEFMAAAEALK